MKGLFITFEGPDGAGKTTQMKRLSVQLWEEGYDIVVTREPGGTPIGDQIRTVLLAPENAVMVDQAEILLYAASRAQHVHEKIVPALQAGKIVLCDRFIDASVAYQSYGLGTEVDTVRSINRFASSGLRPSRTYMLDLPAAESRRRLLKRTGDDPAKALDRIEQKPQEYHERVREGFLHIARSEPDRVMLLDATLSEEQLSRRIAEDCKRLLRQMG